MAEERVMSLFGRIIVSQQRERYSTLDPLWRGMGPTEPLIIVPNEAKKPQSRSRQLNGSCNKTSLIAPGCAVAKCAVCAYNANLDPTTSREAWSLFCAWTTIFSLLILGELHLSV
jgi:hypothetical protein